MSAQSRFVAILFVIGVTLIAAVIYIRDIFVFDHGVAEVQACAQTIELGDRASVAMNKVHSGHCDGLYKVLVLPSDGRSRVSARPTPFHDNWLILIDTKGGAVTGVRFGTRKHPDVRPNNAPPDRVSDR